MFSDIQKFDLSSIEVKKRVKSEMRQKMDSIEVGEGFMFSESEDLLKEKQKAQAVANNLNPKGKSFSIQWINGKTAFRVVRTR